VFREEAAASGTLLFSDSRYLRFGVIFHVETAWQEASFFATAERIFRAQTCTQLFFLHRLEASGAPPSGTPHQGHTI